MGFRKKHHWYRMIVIDVIDIVLFYNRNNYFIDKIKWIIKEKIFNRSRLFKQKYHIFFLHQIFYDKDK